MVNHYVDKATTIFLRSSGMQWDKVSYRNFGELHKSFNSSMLIQDNLVLGDNVYLDNNLKVYSNSGVGHGTKIGDGCILGEWSGLRSKYDFKTIVIGKHCTISDDVTIGVGSVIGDNVEIGPNQILGKGCRVDSNVKLLNTYHQDLYGGSINYVGNNKVCFGGLTYPIDFWLDHTKILINVALMGDYNEKFFHRATITVKEILVDLMKHLNIK